MCTLSFTAHSSDLLDGAKKYGVPEHREIRESQDIEPALQQAFEQHLDQNALDLSELDRSRFGLDVARFLSNGGFVSLATLE